MLAENSKIVNEEGTMESAPSAPNLDNSDNTNCTQTSVQMTREMMTSNGCHVTLVFPAESRPGVSRKIAEMFLAAMEKGMSDS